MSGDRKRNAKRNFIFGIVLKLYKTLMPFAIRTAMIYFIGVEYLGLNGLFTSVLGILNIAELGVGEAIVYSMYKPIAEGDTGTICALLKLYKKYYRVIGTIIAVFGIAVTPIIPKIIKGSIPEDINIYIIYLMNLSITVMTYWLFAYKNSLLTAHQREDIVSKTNIIISTLQYLFQILAIMMKSYYIYLTIALIAQVANNILTALVVKRLYPNYIAEGKLSESEENSVNNHIKDLFTSKIGSTVVGSADTIVISAMLGLKYLGIYQNYYFIMTSIIGFVYVIFNSCIAGIGNSLVTETKEKNYYDFRKITFLIGWIATVGGVCLVCLYQPFMEMWVGKELMFEIGTVILFGVYFYLFLIQQIAAVYKDASGIWHSDRFRPLIAGIVNLVSNIILVHYIGINGIVLSTIISYVLVAMPWLILNLFDILFKCSPKDYIIALLQNFGIFTALVLICYLICTWISVGGWIGFILKGIICVVISNIVLYIVHKNTKWFSMSFDLLLRTLFKRA